MELQPYKNWCRTKKIDREKDLKKANKQLNKQTATTYTEPKLKIVWRAFEYAMRSIKMPIL